MAESRSVSSELPKCGLYRTGITLPGSEDQVQAQSLVFFHNHSEQGSPLVLLPHANENNRWTFHERGYLVESQPFIDELVPLISEGYYILSVHVHVGKDDMIPERSLVQVGYNRKAEPLMFVGRFEGNSIAFPVRGYRFESLDLFEQLEPAGFMVPKPKKLLH